MNQLSMSRARKRRRIAALVGLPGLVLTSLAATSPADAATTTALAPDTNLAGGFSSLYQTNNSVNTVTTGGGVIYAGGQFTSLRPPGSAKGSNETARTYLAALNASTGALTSFNPTLNGAVQQVALSSDGATLYVAGRFTTVNSTSRNHFAAFSTSTGALTSWNPNTTGGAAGYSVLPAASGVYIGGLFTKVGGTAHADLAKVSTTTGAVLPAFTATADNYILKMALSPDGTRLITVGGFNTIAGQSLHGIASLNPTTGANQAFDADGTLPNSVSSDPNNPFGGCTATGEDIVISGNTAYVAGDGAQPGCFDGDFAIDVSPGSSGAVKWINSCEGSTVALAVVSGVLYKGSHMHDCAYDPGGPDGGYTGAFAQGDRKWYRLFAQNTADGSFEHWSPNTNSGGTTGVGPLAMATDGTQLIVGGDWTTVNGSSQQGIARFTPKTSSNNAAPTRPATAPTATVTGVGKVQVNVPGTWDADNGVLTYTLYRGSTAVATTTAESWPWAQPRLRFNVTVPSSSTAYTFYIKASDGTVSSAASASSTAVTASAANAPASYTSTVAGQSPSAWWRLAGNGSDSSGNGAPADLVGGVASTATGATAGDGALTLDGSSGYVTSDTQQTNTASYSDSVWFKTTTLTGGDLLGLSSTQTGSDSSPDRAVWMDNDGQVAFAIKTAPRSPDAPPGPPNSTLRSASTYNDGAWHQAVATYDGSTMSLYVDGILVGSQASTAATSAATGFHRVGYTDLSAFNAVFGLNSTGRTSPNSYFFAGSVDEASFYNSALTASQVAAQFAATTGNNS